LRVSDLTGTTAGEAVDASSPECRGILMRGLQLNALGQREGTEEAFRQAGEAPLPDVKAAAWRGIASYLVTDGRMADAIGALQVIVEIGDPEGRPRALRNIGTFKEDTLGDQDGARDAYEAAIAWGHPRHAPGALVNPAHLHEAEGDLLTATRLFLQAINSGHEVEADRARVLLGDLAERQGDDAGARACTRLRCRGQTPNGASGARSCSTATNSTRPGRCL
jgi:tetratricopeptide (TPR) repeat protein